MVIYILTKFGDDWLIFVDARVLTSKLWTDGHNEQFLLYPQCFRKTFTADT